MKSRRVCVTFTEFFEPYGIKAGASRKVSMNVALKLRDVYRVIEDPFASKIPRIRVEVVRSLVKHYGPDWYPTSYHDVRKDMVQEHLDDGSLKIIHSSDSEIPDHDYCSAYCREHYNRSVIWDFLADTPSEYRVPSLALRMQNEKIARKLVNELTAHEE